MKEQMLMGAGIAGMCAVGLWYEAWFLDNTKKGQRLTRWFGKENATWLLRFLLLAGIAFGVLLAVGIINPVRW